MISKIARNISAPESNVHHMHDACNYVIFFDSEYSAGPIIRSLALKKLHHPF